MAKKLPKDEIAELKIKLKESESKFKKNNAKINAQNKEYKAINKKYLKTNEELSEKNSAIIRIMNEMRWNEAKSRQMFSSSPVGIFYYDTQLIISELNFAFSEILSVPYNLLKGFDINTIKDRRVIPSIIESIKGKIGHYEGFYKSTLSGKEVYVSMTNHPLYSRESSTIIIGGVGLVQDLTKWKRTQEQLEENEENLRLTLESIGDCVIVTNQNTEIININTVAEKVLKIKKDNILNKTASDIFSIYNTVLNKYLTCQVKTAIQENRNIAIQENVEIHISDSVKLNASFNISPIRKAGGEVIGAIMVLQDITERIKFQQDIIESENKFKSLFDNSPTGIALFDIEGNVKEVNNPMLKILGSPSVEATKTINVLKFPPLVKVGFVNDFNECVTKGNNINRLTEYTTNWGKKIFVQYSISPHKEKENKVIGVILNMVDVTAQKQAEEQEKKYLHDLEFITNSTLNMLELPENADPLKFIGEKLKTIIGNNTIIVNKFNENSFSIEYVFATEERLKKIKNILNKNPQDFKIYQSPKVHDLNFTKKIIELNPVDFFVNIGFSDKEKASIFVEKQNVNKVYFMGICASDKLLANITIITYSNETIKNKEVIESFINQVSLVLHRKIAQRNLTYAEKLYNNTLNSITELIFVTDCNFRILFANSAIKNILKNIGLNKNIKGLKIKEALPFLRENIYDAYNEVVKNKTPRFSEETNNINGEIFHTQTIITPVIENNEVVRIITSVRDITKIKQSENEIASLKEINENIINNMTQGIIMEDDKGIIVMANPAFCKMFDFELNELIGKATFNIIPKNIHQKVKKYKESISSIKIHSAEIEFTTKKDKVITAIQSVLPIFIDGTIKNIACVYTDITNRKIIEKELLISKERAEESDKLKSAFLANMSHELRTPINGIIGFSNLLQKNDVTNDKKDNYISQINTNSSLLLRLIDDIIDVAKIESGKLTIEKSPCNISVLMNDLYLHYKQDIKTQNKNNIQLIYNQNEYSDLNIFTDPLRLKQVLLNLLSNAVKFTNQGKIEYGFDLINNNLQFYVKDTGIGIKSENLSKIFDRFTQLEVSISRKYGGTGLGLTISKNIIELLGGKIWVESEWKKGTAFYFLIPAEIIKFNKIFDEKEKIKLSENHFSNYTILVAEDDDLNYMFIEEMLSETKIKLIRAFNGLEALNIVKTNINIDIILMDIQMPVMDGYQSTKLILETKPDLPIIAQTAFALSTEKEKSLKSGCVDYISKPIDLEELIIKIKKYLPGK